MALYLGSFAGGMFSGAQSIFGLYKEYQGVKRQSELDDIADKRKAARDEEEAGIKKGVGGSRAVPGTQDFTGTGGEQYGPPAPTPASAPGGEQYGPPEAPEQYGPPEAPEQYGPPEAYGPPELYGPPRPGEQYGPPAPPQPNNVRAGRTGSPPGRPASPGMRGRGGSGVATPRGQYGPPEDPNMVGGISRQTYPWDPANPIGTQAIGANGSAVDPRSIQPGAASDVAAHEGVQPEPSPPPSRYPTEVTNQPVGTTVGLGGGPSALSRPSAISNQSRISNQPVGATTQGAPTGISRTAPTNQPIPSQQPGGPYMPPAQRDPRPPQQQGPTEAIPPGETVREGPQQGPPETQQGPYMPPPQRDPRPPQQQGPTEAIPGAPPPQGVGGPVMRGGPGVRGGMPQASAEPPSLGRRLLNSIISPAHAEEVPHPEREPGAIPPGGASPPGGANAPVEFPPKGPVQNVPPSPLAGQTTAAPPAQTQGITTAKPPVAAAPTGGPPSAPAVTPPHPTAGPVAVAGTQGKVEQSQSTPPVLAPPVSVSYYNQTKASHPERIAMVERAIRAEHAEGLVSPEYMLATIARENPGWNNNIDHGTGVTGYRSSAKGIVQIIDSTRRGIDPNGELDWRDPEQNIRLGVRLYKEQAKSLGANSLQNAMVYRAGYTFLNGVKNHGWDGYAALGPEQRSQVTDMMKMFPGTKLADIPLPATGAGHGSYDAAGLYQRAQKEGPDGLLRGLAETGPAGLGMSDRWRAYQGALEDHLIRSGHPEMAPMAAEWTAQMSHQGTISNLIAADQAIMGGDAHTAIQYLAKAHAFFPDGTYARFGADDKGQIWGYQISEQSGKPTGPPRMVTHDDVAKMMVGLQNPVTYVKTMQEMRKNNAAIDLSEAHADYYKQLPGIKEEQMKAAQEKEAARQQAAQEKEAARQQSATEKAAAAEKARIEKQDLIAGHTKDVDDETAKVYPPEPTDSARFTPEEYPMAANVYRQLRKHPEVGGADMSGTDAYRLANGLAAGATEGSKNPQLKMQLLPSNKEGQEPAWAITDKDGKVQRLLTYQQGEYVRGIIGLAGSAPLKAGAPPGAAAPAPAAAPAQPAPAARPRALPGPGGYAPPAPPPAPAAPLQVRPPAPRQTGTNPRGPEPDDPIFGKMSALPRQGISRMA
jgi:hypothetical protein